MLFFEENEIEGNSKKRAILLLSVGAETCEVIKSIVPAETCRKTFQRNCGFTKRVPSTKPNKIAKRSKFNMRNKKEGE